jgi:hypothetical protein
MGLFDKVLKNVSEVAVSAGVSAGNAVAMKKLEAELADVNSKYDECYIIIGKRVSESLRNGEDVSDPQVKQAFVRISSFDSKKAEIESKIRELKGDEAQREEAAKLLAVEAEAEKEIEKCKQLLELGVDAQDEFDRKVALIRNRVTHHKRLDALKEALAKGLITESDFKAKTAAILGQPVSS